MSKKLNLLNSSIVYLAIIAVVFVVFSSLAIGFLFGIQTGSERFRARYVNGHLNVIANEEIKQTQILKKIGAKIGVSHDEVK